jgi:hypothetical protein
VATVMLSNAIIPVVYESYEVVNNPKLTAIFDSGICVPKQQLAAAFSSGGTVFTVPAWGDIDRTVEPNYSTDNPATLATPLAIGTLEWNVRKANMNQIWSAADLVEELAGSDPMARIRARTDVYWLRRWQSRLLAACIGLYNSNVAVNSGDMTYDISAGAGVTPTSNNTFSHTSFTGSIFTMGEHFGDINAIMVHPIVAQNMINQELIQFVQPEDVPIAIPYYAGKRVIIDEDMPIIPATGSGGTLVPAKYLSILFGTAAFGYAMGTPMVPVEVFRWPSQGNGGGVEELHERKTLIMHPTGWSFNSATVSGGTSATNADLQLAANWTREIYRESLPMSFLITNG